MKTLRVNRGWLLALALTATSPAAAHAQCCLSEFFAGCGTCFRKAPVYAVAPVAAPIAAPMVAAPPPPMMVPVQQTSYVPETTYRTQYQNVPVTTYKPSCEIDPCTGCPRDCYQPVTQYVQQAVNVPVTQYRAVTTTKYVQMQPGYAAAPGYPTAPGYPAAPVAGPASPAASPFAAPIQTTPQAWGAAGADVPQQLIPGQPSMSPPALPAGTYQQPTFQQPAYQQPAYQQPTFQQPITPQSGTVAAPPAMTAPALQPTQPPALAPAPSLRPIPDLQRNGNGVNGSGNGVNGSGNGVNGSGNGVNGSGNGSGTPVQPSLNGGQGMPVLPGSGPGAATGAFPRLLEPTSHTTSWQPATNLPTMPSTTMSTRSYPTAALPMRLTQ
jgi:hypothetical protein